MKKIVALVLSLVMVLGLATTAMAATTTTAAEYDLYLADTAVGTLKAEDKAYTTYEAVKNEDGSGVLSWIAMNSQYFVVIDKADATIADYYVTKANEKTPLFYLHEITAGEVDYARTAVAFTDAGVKCGQMNVAYADIVAEVEFYLHTDVYGVKTFYASKAITTAAAPYYNGKTTTTTATQLLVDGEVVKGYAFTDSPLNAHVWSPSAYDKTTPVKALCGLCGASADLYTAAKTPANSVIVGTLNVTDATGTVTYNVVPAAAAQAPAAGDKVESAETFDAGIAMYVGMSVMAAAGSAVVLKKKD